MRRMSSFILRATVVALALANGAAFAQSTDPPPPPGAGGIGDANGGFLITPRRVVFEERLRSTAVSVINSGSDTATFRVSLVRMRMSETGDFAVVDSALADEAFADTLVRFSPRQIQLGPRETQVVRLQLRKPTDLPAGEYRSHLLVQAIPRPRASEEPDTGRVAGVQVKIVPVYGTAIPVIVRHGDTAAEVSFSDLDYQPGGAGGPATASFRIRRQGNRSVYGDLTLTHVPANGAPQVVGVAKGVSVYSPNPSRRVRVPLAAPASALPAGGRLLVRYNEPAPDGQLIAQSSLDLP